MKKNLLLICTENGELTRLDSLFVRPTISLGKTRSERQEARLDSLRADAHFIFSS